MAEVLAEVPERRGLHAVALVAVEVLVEVGRHDRLLAGLARERLGQPDRLDDLADLSVVDGAGESVGAQEPRANELLRDRRGAAHTPGVLFVLGPRRGDLGKIDPRVTPEPGVLRDQKGPHEKRRHGIDGNEVGGAVAHVDGRRRRLLRTVNERPAQPGEGARDLGLRRKAELRRDGEGAPVIERAHDHEIEIGDAEVIRAKVRQGRRQASGPESSGKLRLRLHGDVQEAAFRLANGAPRLEIEAGRLHHQAFDRGQITVAPDVPGDVHRRRRSFAASFQRSRRRHLQRIAVDDPARHDARCRSGDREATRPASEAQSAVPVPFETGAGEIDVVEARSRFASDVLAIDRDPAGLRLT